MNFLRWERYIFRTCVTYMHDFMLIFIKQTPFIIISRIYLNIISLVRYEVGFNNNTRQDF